MKRQFKLGLVLAGLMGSVLFGMTDPDGLAHASEQGRAQADESLAKTADGALLADLGVTPGAGMAGAGVSSCPAGMVDVEGDYCPLVEQKCVRWVDPETKQRCADFEP